MRTPRRLSVLLALVSPLAAFAQVPYQRVLDSAKEPQNWLTYGGNYYDQRFSGLKPDSAECGRAEVGMGLPAESPCRQR